MNAAGPLFRLSLRRFRARPARTALAIAAIAAGVAFVLAIQAANRSPVEAMREFERAVGGEVDRLLVTRTQDGAPEDAYARVEALPQVSAAAPILQRLVRVDGAGGSARVALAGVDQRLRAFDPPAVSTELLAERGDPAIGLYLSARVARRISVRAGDPVTVRDGSRIRQTYVAAIIDGPAGEALKNVSVALAPLGLVQGLTGGRDRVTHVLVKLRANTFSDDASLARAAGDRFDVTRAGHEAGLMASVSMIERQIASLLATLTLLIGALLVYNVAALNAFDNRRDLAALRLMGANRRLALAHATLESAALGLAGSVAGVVLGRLLLTVLAGNGPEYLAPAFLVDESPIVPLWLIASSVVAGTLAAVAGGVAPIVGQLRSPSILVAERMSQGAHASTSARARVRTAVMWIAAVGVVAGSGLAIAVPSAATVGVAMVVIGGGLAIPAITRASLTLARRLLPRPAGSAQLGIAELRTAPGRATALASICAMCLGALVLIGGTTSNFSSGMATLSGQMFNAADLWVSLKGPENSVNTVAFDARDLRHLRDVPGVRSLHPYRLAFLDIDGRRVLAISYARGVTRRLTGQEYVRGDRGALSAGLPNDGDVAISDELARSMGLRLGQRFPMPTPTGSLRARYAATISNYGWQAGAVTMGATTFARAWSDDRTSMIGVVVDPDADVGTVYRRIRAVLAERALFRVETRAEGMARGARGVQQGMARVKQTRVAIFIGAILAITAATMTAVVQRRRRLAGLCAIGMSPRQAFASLIGEIGWVLAIGAAVGFALGLIGQVLVVLAFTSVGYPIEFSPNAAPFGEAVTAAIVIALAASAVSIKVVFRRPVAEGLAFE